MVSGAPWRLLMAAYNNNIVIRTLGTLASFTTVYGYYDSSYKYQLSICDNLRLVMTLSPAGFEPAQRGRICSLPAALTIRPAEKGNTV